MTAQPKTIPKTLHLYWGKDKPLSWLRWMTVKSFAALNPDWQVIVWSPARAGTSPRWRTKEHSHYAWNGPDWLKRLKEAGPNVETRQAPIDDFPAMTEVHRSDLLRWRLLYTMGGFWSDIDILYFRPMADLDMDLTADALLCWGETEELKDWQAIGFLAGKPGCALFKEMEQVGLTLAKMPNLAYQDLGTFLLTGFAKPRATESVGSKIGQIPMHTVYPFHTVQSQAPALWKHKGMLDVRDSTIGVHWFAAQRKACRVEARWSGLDDVLNEIHEGGIKWAMKRAGFIDYEEPSGIEYSIIMPYIDRPLLLHNTLVSYFHWYMGRNDWELVLVQDSKCTRLQELNDVVQEWQRKGLEIKVVEQEGPDAYGPSLCFNRGVQDARGRYLVLTSPEIFHESDVLAGLDTAFAEDPAQYIICACQSRRPPKNFRKIGQYWDLQGRPDKWIQHSIHRPARYHFCSVISKEQYLKIGGFDEEFAMGFCFDDDDFRDTVIEAGIKIVQRDDLPTSHQYHDHCAVPEKMERWDRNKALYEKKHGPYRHSPEPQVQVAQKAADIKPLRPGELRVAVLCVLKSGGYFTPEYVYRLRNMVERNTTVPYEFICLTDFERISGFNVAELSADLPGWWSKIELFRPGITTAPRLVYFDLDTLIMKNIDDLLNLAGDFYGLTPWNRSNRANGQLGSGIMAWKNGAFEHLFTDFDRTWIHRPQGDQVYISSSLAMAGVQYRSVQDSVPGIYSYKRECRGNRLPRNAKIICFHGKPRVHEVRDKWVMEAWR